MTLKKTRKRKPYQISNLDAEYHARIADLIVRGEAANVGEAMSLMHLGDADRRRLYRQVPKALPQAMALVRKQADGPERRAPEPERPLRIVNPWVGLQGDALQALVRAATRQQKLAEAVALKLTPQLPAFKAHLDMVRSIREQYRKAIPLALIDKLQSRPAMIAEMLTFIPAEGSTLGRLLTIREEK